MNVNILTLSGLLRDISVCVVYPAGETTDRSVKVFEFSELMKDMTVLLRMYYQKFSEVFLVF